MKVFLSFVAAIACLYFLAATGPISYKSIAAYSSDQFSEIASNYANAKIESDFNTGRDHKVELIAIKLDHGYESILMAHQRKSQLEISYKVGSEIFEFETLYPTHRTGESVIWVDMTVPEDIRIYNSEYKKDDQQRLRQYANDVKNIIDISIELISAHIEDQTGWQEVFTSGKA